MDGWVGEWLGGRVVGWASEWVSGLVGVNMMHKGGVQDTWLLLNFTTIFDMVCIQAVATYDDTDRHMHACTYSQ